MTQSNDDFTSSDLVKIVASVCMVVAVIGALIMGGCVTNDHVQDNYQRMTLNGKQCLVWNSQPDRTFCP